MAIAFGGTVAGVTAATISSVSISGSNTLGLLATVGDNASDSITSVTWDGSAMTKIASVQNASERFIQLWRIVAPSAGVTDIVMTGGTFKRGMSGFYTGVDQTTPIDSFNTGNQASAAAISIATTVVASNCWGVMVQKDDNGGLTYTSSNILSSTRQDTDAGGLAWADSNGTISTGSQTGTLTGTGTPNHGGIMLSITPAVAATSIKDLIGGGVIPFPR